MQWIEAIILGLVQGLTEFLPISSSAHLRIVGEFLPGAADPGAAFTAITQLGTELAVLVYFWRDIVRILKAWFAAILGKLPHSDADVRMGWLIIVGTIPIVVLGLLLEDMIESVFRTLWLTATMLVVFGVLLAFADAYGKQRKPLDELSVRDGILFGFAQAMALIPGVSRSGGTITAGLLMGYTREAAARYSFLLAIPAVFGSGFYKLFGSLGEQTGPYTMGQTLVATAVGFFVAYLIIGWFLKYVSTNSYTLFVNYRILLGLFVYVMLGLGIINA
ncbi:MULTISPECIES: undecaprenyl-diphosphate phosphatase [Nesterenkonia]|uniref:Undecaprenyl-diphosphatase n=2 Tax=Nesterenkonia TaxID=57494 RepID=A0A0W8IDZ4_9MICC|nr:undecaprenyl-diphosphate phosphatase [Nesterenkonia jeotgali]KUG58154.1 UDP-diphosphatase [Nesterenkonia jeotgali]MBA8920955.1 undecaprenyl-diphosphatase [Nesterenkonia jeotgali]NYJ17478.1 undecaprenyl-diphosphatase [Nesterenkonia sandarakina]